MPTTAWPDQQCVLRTKLSEYLPEDVAYELSTRHTLINYRPGAIPFSHRPSTDLIFWVVSGYMKIYCPTREADRILVRIAGPGDMLGYANVLDLTGELSQSLEAQALTKCTLALTPRRSLLRHLESLDSASIASLMERMNTSWSGFCRRLVTFLGLSFRQRLELVFAELASRFGVPDQRGVVLDLKLSHAELAEMIDSSRSMVTMLIGAMIADGSLYRLGNKYVVPVSPVDRPDANRSPAGSLSEASSAGVTNHRRAIVFPRLAAIRGISPLQRGA